MELLLEKLEEANDGRIRAIGVACIYRTDDPEYADEDYFFSGELEYEAKLVHALEKLKLSLTLPYVLDMTEEDDGY